MDPGSGGPSGGRLRRSRTRSAAVTGVACAIRAEDRGALHALAFAASRRSGNGARTPCAPRRTRQHRAPARRGLGSPRSRRSGRGPGAPSTRSSASGITHHLGPPAVVRPPKLVRVTFVDECTVFVKAGRGGNGSASLHSEPYKPHGGPDGGNGGRGRIGGVRGLARGPRSVVDRGPSAPAGAGRRPADSARRDGATGKDLVIPVPDGTVVFDEEGLIADLVGEGSRAVVARGGRGGRGNAALASARNRVPRTPSPVRHGEDEAPACGAPHGRRRRARGVAERRQVHAAVSPDCREAEDRELSLHHAHAEPGRGRRGRRSVRGRRHPRPGGGRAPRGGAWDTGSYGTSCVAGRSCWWWICPPPIRPRTWPPSAGSSPRYDQSSAMRRRSWWARRPTWSTIRLRRSRAVGRTRSPSRRSPARDSRSCCERVNALASEAAGRGARARRRTWCCVPGRPRFTVTREGRGWRVKGRSVERWVLETDLDDEIQLAKFQQRLVREGVERSSAELGANPGRRGRDRRPGLRVHPGRARSGRGAVDGR